MFLVIGILLLQFQLLKLSHVVKAQFLDEFIKESHCRRLLSSAKHSRSLHGGGREGFFA